jgi:hypothetical protein
MNKGFSARQVLRKVFVNSGQYWRLPLMVGG